MESTREVSVVSCQYGLDQYGTQGVLASSAHLGWAGLSAELRSHARGVISWKGSKAEKEVCVAISPSNSPVTRSGGGIVDRTTPQRGTVWMCQPEEHLIEFSAPLPLLHIYLPYQQFSADSLGVDIRHAAQAAFFQQGFHDPLIAEIAFAMVSELRTPTAGGKLLAETLAVSLAARLMQHHIGPPPTRDVASFSTKGLDRRRLTRVKEYIAANLEADLTIAQLAKVASLSRFHFARAFKAAVGQSPHQYVSAHRLERAKQLLTRDEQPMLDIALSLNFSSQANFTRAFRQSTGMTPGQYRRSLPRY